MKSSSFSFVICDPMKSGFLAFSLLANFLKHSWPLAIHPRWSQSINEPRKSKNLLKNTERWHNQIAIEASIDSRSQGWKLSVEFHLHPLEMRKDFPRKRISSCAGNGDRRQFIILSPSVCLLLAQIVILIKTDIIDSRVIKKYSSHKKFTHRSLQASTLEWFMPFWGVSRFSHCHLCDSKLSPFIAGSVVRGNCCTSILSPYPLRKRKWKAVNDES